MMFAKYGQAVLTVHERSSRILLAVRPDNKTANLIADLILRCSSPFPSQLRRTVTFDNGTEFARHTPPAQPRPQTFFCDPYALGKKAESRTPSAECDASSRAKPISPPSPTPLH